MITNDGKLAQIFNEYFVNIVPSLGITSFQENNDNVYNDNIDNIIIKFEGHPIIVAIKEQMKKYNKTFIMNKNNQKPTDMFDKQDLTVYLTYIKRFDLLKDLLASGYVNSL